MSKRQGLEWLSMAYVKGYADGEAGAPKRYAKTLGREIIGPVYGDEDAEHLRLAYVFGYGMAEDEKEESE